MPPFHEDRGELHGVTVVVATDGSELWVGRCDTFDERGAVLYDADRHDEREAGPSREEYLARAARFGVWKRHDRVVISRQRIVSIRPLGELAIPDPPGPD